MRKINIFRFLRLSASRFFLPSSRFLKLSLATSLPLFLFKNISYSFFENDQNDKNNIFPSIQSQVLTFYSKTDNRPICSGLLLESDGSFLTISDLINKKNSEFYYAKVINSDKIYNLQIEVTLPDEGIAFGKILALDNNYEELKNINKTEIIDKKDLKIGQKCYMLSKDSNDLNYIKTARINEINLKALDSSENLFLINSTEKEITFTGAPLFKKNGNIIGLISPISDKIPYLSVYNSPELGFFCEQYRKNNEIKRPYLGMSIKYSENSKGMVVVKLNSEGPAKNTGLKMGDIIREVNGRQISSNSDFLKELGFKGNKRLYLKVLRGRDVLNLELVTD